MSLLSTAQAQKHASQPKRKKSEPEEAFTLRYKPQLVTWLYDAKTTVIHDFEHGLKVFPIVCNGQLAFRNTRIDLNHENWTFERYFTKLNITLSKQQVLKDRDSVLPERGVINRSTRLTYDLTGHELDRHEIDTIRFTSDEAQFAFFFIQPPRLLIPLPKGKIGYGSVWREAKIDTLTIKDGECYYNAIHNYTFEKLVDTLGGMTAMIVDRQTGVLTGSQMAANLHVNFKGPIAGEDTTYLDLLSGRVVLQVKHLKIPITDEVPNMPSISEDMEVRSVITYDRMNASNTAPAPPDPVK